MDGMSILTVVGTIATVIGTIATIISTVIAVKAKNEAKEIWNHIREEKSRNIKSNGQVIVKNSGNNSGILSGINSGEIRK